MIVKEITEAWLGLGYTARKELYKSLSAEGKSELKTAVTERHMARVPAAKRTAHQCEQLENGELDSETIDGMWTGFSWYLHTGEVGNLLEFTPDQMRPVRDALQPAYEGRVYYC